MNRFFTLLLAASCVTAVGQVTYPYNPDGNADSLISVPDIQDFLTVYGNNFVPNEIMVGDSTLSSWVLSLSETANQQAAMISSLSELLNEQASIIDGLMSANNCVQTPALTPDCNSIQNLELGTLVFPLSGNTLQMVAYGGNCEETQDLISSPIETSNYTNKNYFLAFQVTDSLWVDALSASSFSGSSAYPENIRRSIVRALDADVDSDYDPNEHGIGVYGNSAFEFGTGAYSTTDTKGPQILVPGRVYVWELGRCISCTATSYGYPTNYTLFPEFNDSFVIIGAWSRSWQMGGGYANWTSDSYVPLTNTFAQFASSWGMKFRPLGKRLISIN